MNENSNENLEQSKRHIIGLINVLVGTVREGMLNFVISQL